MECYGWNFADNLLEESAVAGGIEQKVKNIRKLPDPVLKGFVVSKFFRLAFH